MQNNNQLVRRDAQKLESSRAYEYAYPDLSGPGGDGESLRLKATLRRYRMPIAIIFAACVVLALLLTKFSEPSYQAKILLEVLGVNQEFLNTKALDPNTSMPTPDNYVETQTKLLTTDEVIDRTARVVAPTIPESVLNRHGIVERIVHLFTQQPFEPRSAEGIIKQMIRKAKVKPEGQANLISVTMEGPDARVTADVANTLADQYIEQVQEGRWNAAARTGEFLGRQLEGMRTKLQKSEDALQSYARTAGLIYTETNTSKESVASERLRQVQSDLARAEADLTDKQSQLELVRNSPIDALPKVFDDGALREYKTRLAELNRQKADLLVSFSPEHYKVQHIQSQISELEAELARERSTIVHRIENDYQAARRREQLLSGSYSKQLSTVSDQSLAQVRYNMLQREVEANREVYQSMLQRVKEASVISALRASNVRVANAAKPALKPDSPDLLQNLAVALLGASMISVLFVLLKERSNRSIRMPGESIKLIAVPELGVIPSTKVLERTPMLNGNKKLLPIAGAKGGNNQPVAITAWHGNESLVKESIRSVVTSLVMYGESFYRNRIILMTSPHPQAGKTTAVSNLGLALAESGRRVLIIDGDLRRPRLSAIFGVQEDAGFADLLKPDHKSEPVNALIQPSGYPNLFILPSGEITGDLPRLLHSARLEEILGAVRNEFDFILLDSPPMLALTDARLLSRCTDGVILVCRAGRTTAEQLSISYRRLAEDGIEVIGTILNDWNARTEDPTYFSAYSEYAKSAGS